MGGGKNLAGVGAEAQSWGETAALTATLSPYCGLESQQLPIHLPFTQIHDEGLPQQC